LGIAKMSIDKVPLALHRLSLKYYKSGCQVQGSQFTVGCIQNDIGATLGFRLLGVSQESDELRIRR